MGHAHKAATIAEKRKVAERLFATAEARGIGDTDLAAILNLSPITLAKWRAGKNAGTSIPDLLAAIDLVRGTKPEAAKPEATKAAPGFVSPAPVVPSAASIADALVASASTKALLAELARRLGA